MDKSLISQLEKWHISDQEWQSALQSDERICYIHNHQNQMFWLKKQAPARGYWRYKALNLFSRLAGIPLIKSVPQYGGQTALNTEARRITSLASKGIVVPELLIQQPGFLLLSHLGDSLIIQFKDPNTSQGRKRALLTACLQAINSVHQKNQHLSQAFVRNMVQVSEEPLIIGFIDFEDDPKTVMSLPEAQARDLLLFVDSVARFFLQDRVYFQQAITRFLAGHDPQMVRTLKETTNKLQWVTRMPFQSLLGHDYEKLKLALLAMKTV